MKLTHTAELEVDGLDTNCEIEFESYFGQVEVTKITDLETGNAVEASIPVWLFDKLDEIAADAIYDENERRMEDAAERRYDGRS